MSILFLKSPSAVELAGNTIHLKIAGTDAFVAGFIQPFYRIGIRIQENNNEIVTCERPVYEPTQNDNVPEGSGIMQINIEDVLRKEYRGHFTFPEPDAGLHFTHPILREIQVFAYEKFGVPPVDKPGELSEVFRVLQGKISIFREGELNYLEKSWYESFLEKPQFLTSANPDKIIDIYQPERLYYLFPQAGTYKLKVREFYKDVEYDEQATSVTKLFETGFTNWVNDPDPLFPSQPYGLDISSADAHVSAVRENNNIRINITGSTNGIPDHVDILFKSPNNVLAAGKYRFTINLLEKGGQVHILSSAPHNDNIPLNVGENVINLTFVDYAFVRIQFFGEGTYLMSSIKLESIVNSSTPLSEYVEDFEKAVFNVEAFEIKEFLTSYYKLRSNNGKKIIKYKVFLTDAADNVLLEWLYRIDYRNYDYARYFMFLNDFGVYEVVRTTGKGRKSDDVKKSTVKVPLSDNFNATARVEKQISETEDITYIVNSGYFRSKFEADWFRIFRKSRDVYQLKKGKAYPIYILDSKAVTADDDNYHLSTEFSYTHAIGDDFTEVLKENIPVITGSFNIDFNTDFFVGNVPPDPPAPVTYSNDEQYRDFTRNNCGAGSNGSVVRYSVPAGKYTSDTKAKANQLALDEINAQGQANANTKGTCTVVPPTYYYNLELRQTFSRNNCGGISEGSQVEYVVAAGKHQSTISQADADRLAQEDMDNNGQANANQYGYCTWYNQALTKSANKTGCSLDKYGSEVVLTVNEGTYSSQVSQADANQKAQDYLNANAQANADATGVCVIRDLLNVMVLNPNNKTATIYFDAPDPAFNKWAYEGTQQSVKLLRGVTYTVRFFGTMAGISGLGIIYNGESRTFTPDSNVTITLY